MIILGGNLDGLAQTVSPSLQSRGVAPSAEGLQWTPTLSEGSDNTDSTGWTGAQWGRRA